MAKKRSEDLGPLDRIFATLDDAAPGLHDITPPTDELPAGLPEPLIELYARCDGARLFIDALELVPAREAAYDGGMRWRFAVGDGDAVSVDARGKVWRADASIDD